MVQRIKRKTLLGGSDFDKITRHVPALRLVFARFDPRQIGPRLPAPAGATAAPAKQARPDLAPPVMRQRPCLPPYGVQQSGRAFPHRGTADPTLGPGRGAGVKVRIPLSSYPEPHKSGSDFDGIARHVSAPLMVFARFDPRQIGPRLPAPAGAPAAPARQARPDLPAIGEIGRAHV